MALDKRGKSQDLTEESLEGLLKEIGRQRAIRGIIWGTYVCQDLLRRTRHDKGGLSQIFKHKLAYRALIARGRVQGSEMRWLPGLDPESQASALARPAARLAEQRGRSLAARTPNFLARLPSSVE